MHGQKTPPDLLHSHTHHFLFWNETHQLQHYRAAWCCKDKAETMYHQVLIIANWQPQWCSSSSSSCPSGSPPSPMTLSCTKSRKKNISATANLPNQQQKPTNANQQQKLHNRIVPKLKTIYVLIIDRETKNATNKKNLCYPNQNVHDGFFIIALISEILDHKYRNSGPHIYWEVKLWPRHRPGLLEHHRRHRTIWVGQKEATKRVDDSPALTEI